MAPTRDDWLPRCSQFGVLQRWRAAETGMEQGQQARVSLGRCSAGCDPGTGPKGWRRGSQAHSSCPLGRMFQKGPERQGISEVSRVGTGDGRHGRCQSWCNVEAAAFGEGRVRQWPRRGGVSWRSGGQFGTGQALASASTLETWLLRSRGLPKPCDGTVSGGCLACPPGCPLPLPSMLLLPPILLTAAVSIGGLL